MSRLDALIRFAYANFAGGIPILRHAEVEEVRATMNMSSADFFDCFARRVAHEYHAENISFEVADCAMNSLEAYCLAQYDVTLPSYARDVYCAFDQGEFNHRDDDASVDPELQYTKPEIQAIVERDRILGA